MIRVKGLVAKLLILTFLDDELRLTGLDTVVENNTSNNHVVKIELLMNIIFSDNNMIRV